VAVTRSLFIYWKIDPTAAAMALAGMAMFQQTLRQRHIGLVARLYRRADEAGTTVTLMESYACPGGIDATLQAAIVDAGASACARWCHGQRHVEVFDEWPADPGPPDPP